LLQKDIDNIVTVITKTTSDVLVSKLNMLDAEKYELQQQLCRVREERKIPELSPHELICSSKPEKCFVQELSPQLNHLSRDMSIE